MVKKAVAVTTVVLMLTASALADDLSFHEEGACRRERSDATVYVAPPLDEMAVSARAETQCRDLLSAKKSRKANEACQRWRDEAAASVERNRAARRSALALRDANAKKLAECVDGERRAHNERVAARKVEEERKIAEATANRERTEALLSSTPTVRLALSALICVSNNERADALRAIKDEKKYARIGGVQNLSKIYDLQQEVAAADRRTTWLRGELKKRKTTAIKCGDRTVRQVATCIGSAVEDGSCLVEEVAGPLQVTRMIELE